jgi:hypothetical protein
MVLSKLHVKYVYLNLFGRRWGAKFMKKFKGNLWARSKDESRSEIITQGCDTA